MITLIPVIASPEVTDTNHDIELMKLGNREFKLRKPIERIERVLRIEHGIVKRFAKTNHYKQRF